jgi:LysM repeat protein
MEEPAIKKPEYPSREFIINQTRVIYAKAGTSLLAIAQKYDIDLNRILDFNHLQNEEVLIEDQLVFLQRKRKVGNNEFHIMEQGENIYGISQSEGIRVESLMELNHLAKGMEPAIGEKLYLRHKAAEQPKLKGKESVALKQETPQTIEPEVLKHIVGSKETLYAISKKYGVTEGNIVEWNNLKNSHLKKGQELIIYKN